MPDLTFTQHRPGGRILLMLGPHQVGAVFPPPNVTTLTRPVWRWSFWLPGDGISRTIVESKGNTEQAAKNALLAQARDWLRRRGLMGKRSTFERAPRDFYPTPMEAVLPLLPHLEFGTMFAEPCAGDGALIRALEKHGMSCVEALDIDPRTEMAYRGDALDWSPDPSADWIITNPPWDRSTLHPMIERFAAMRPTWLLFDADWVHTKQAAPMLPLLRIIVSVGRVKWIPDSKMTGKDNCAWHLFYPDSDGQTHFYGRAA